MGEPTTQTTLATAGSQVQPDQGTTAPKLQPILGPDGKPPVVQLKGGRSVTVLGWDPQSKCVVTTCADSGELRKEYRANHDVVRGHRESNPNIKEAAHKMRDTQDQPIIVFPIKDKKGDIPTIDEIQKAAKKTYGQLHIVGKTPTDPKEKEAAAQEDKYDIWQNPSDFTWGEWATWILIVGGLAAVGILGFRDGGWFRSKKKRSTSTTPTTPSTPDNDRPGVTLPDHEDVHTNNNTNTNGNTGPNLNTGTNTSTNTGSATTVVGNSAGNAVNVTDGMHVSDNANYPTLGPSKGRF